MSFQLTPEQEFVVYCALRALLRGEPRDALTDAQWDAAYALEDELQRRVEDRAEKAKRPGPEVQCDRCGERHRVEGTECEGCGKEPAHQDEDGLLWCDTCYDDPSLDGDGGPPVGRAEDRDG